MVFQGTCSSRRHRRDYDVHVGAQRERDAEHEYEVAVVSSEKRAWLGVSVEDMSERARPSDERERPRRGAGELGLGRGPAEKAGIKKTTSSCRSTGRRSTTPADLTRAVAKAEPGKAAECVVMRRTTGSRFR